MRSGNEYYILYHPWYFSGTTLLNPFRLNVSKHVLLLYARTVTLMLKMVVD